MKNIFLLVVFLIFTVGAVAQVDNSTTTRAPGELLGSKSKSLLKLQGNHSLSNTNNPYGNISEPGKEEKKPINLTTNNGLMEYKLDDFTPKALKEKESNSDYRKTQYLGDFTTGGDHVELYCRDHEYVDGDKVKITVNGVVVSAMTSLGAGFTPIYVRLNSGLNEIQFEALNQGTSGPNTAELRVIDAEGKEVIKQQWNLMTGGIASLVVVKQ
ncbi:MAG: hypothetical protein WBL21_12080 [Salinimicrobium sp.]